jgi:hypothetical protein
MTPEEAGMMREEDERLERLWEAYRMAAPAPEPSANFMPELWAKIEASRAASWVDPLRWLVARLAPILAALIVAMGLYWQAADVTPASYVDTLAAGLIEEAEDTI